MRTYAILITTFLALTPNLLHAAAPTGPNGVPTTPCDPPTAEEQMPPGMTFSVHGYVTESCGGNAPFVGYDVEVITHLTLTDMCEPPPLRSWTKDRVFTTAVTDNNGFYSAAFTSDDILPEIPLSHVLGTLKVRVRVLDPNTGELIKQSIYHAEDAEDSRNFPIDVDVSEPFAPTMLTNRMTAPWTSYDYPTPFTIAWTENSTNAESYRIERRVPGSDWETIREIFVDRNPKLTEALLRQRSAVIPNAGQSLLSRQTFEIVDRVNVSCGDSHDYRIAAVNNCATVYTDSHNVAARWKPHDLDPNILYTVNGQLTGCVFFDPAAYRVDIAVNAFYVDPTKECPHGPNLELILGGVPTDSAGRFTFDFALTEITDLIPDGFVLKSMYILPEVYHVDTNQRYYTRDKIYLTRFAGSYTLDLDVALIPPIPTDLRVTGNTTNSISLAWDYNAPTSQQPKEYKVFDFTGGSMVYLKTVQARNTRVTGLSADTEYRFKVTAVYDCEESGSSRSVTGRTEKDPDADTGNDDDQPNPGCTKPELGFFTAGIIMTPTFPEPGEPFTVYWEIANFGQTETGPFKDRVELDNGAGNGGETYTHSFPSIAANAGANSVYWRRIEHPGLPAGNHYWYVYLDSENKVDECNENNNVTSYGQVLRMQIGSPQPLSFAAEIARADLDTDDDVDQDDLQRVHDCRGEIIDADGGFGLIPPCLTADLNGDRRIDDRDVNLVAQKYTGPAQPIADPAAPKANDPVANNDVNDLANAQAQGGQPAAAAGGMCGSGVGLSLSFGLLGLSCMTGSSTGLRRQRPRKTNM